VALGYCDGLELGWAVGRNIDCESNCDCTLSGRKDRASQKSPNVEHCCWTKLKIPSQPVLKKFVFSQAMLEVVTNANSEPSNTAGP